MNEESGAKNSRAGAAWNVRSDGPPGVGLVQPQLLAYSAPAADKRCGGSQEVPAREPTQLDGAGPRSRPFNVGRVSDCGAWASRVRDHFGRSGVLRGGRNAGASAESPNTGRFLEVGGPSQWRG